MGKELAGTAGADLKKYPNTVKEVRGMGMINGVELANNDIGPQIVNKCFERAVKAFLLHTAEPIL